ILGEARDGLVGYGIELVEHNAMVAEQFRLVIGLQFRLRSRQLWPDRIVNQVQRQTGSVTHGVEALQRSNASFEDTLAALFGHVLRRVARQRANDLDLVLRKIEGQI